MHGGQGRIRIQNADIAASAKGPHPTTPPPRKFDDPSGSGATLSLRPDIHLTKVYNCGPRRTASKGWGIFTMDGIPTGANIILERPTLVFEECSEEAGKEWLGSRKRKSPETTKADRLRKEFEKLSIKQQTDIMSLHNTMRDPEVPTLYGIFLTNFFKISRRDKFGIYTFCSRLNHDCDPNCAFRFYKAQNPEDAKAYTITITARRNIKAGEQLTISYIPLTMRLGMRQYFLSTNHNFTCDCARCVREGDKLYNWPIGSQNRARLRFRPSRPLQPEAGEGQGWDFLAIIENIYTKDGIIEAEEVIMQETPLVLLEKEQVKRNSPYLYNQLLKLPDSVRNKYLRLYNWRASSESPTWRPGPSYEVENTDEEEEEEPTSRLAGWTRKRKFLPPNAILFGIWEANFFTLGDGIGGVFAYASHLNHSCWPTCRVVWHSEHKTLDLVTTMPLKVGDELTICYNYLEIFNLPFEKRQQFLKDNYGFNCACLRCSNSIRYNGPDSSSQPGGIGTYGGVTVKPALGTYWEELQVNPNCPEQKARTLTCISDKKNYVGGGGSSKKPRLVGKLKSELGERPIENRKPETTRMN